LIFIALFLIFSSTLSFQTLDNISKKKEGKITPVQAVEALRVVRG
jgi:hypothetical protein